MTDLLARRCALLDAPIVDDGHFAGPAWCQAFAAATDEWLRSLFAGALGEEAAQGLALAAVGGYGRGELAPHSDLDLVLLYERGRDIAEFAQSLWYPIWDAKLKLGHAVRSVKEAVALAADDIDTATSLLSVRHLCGDRALSDELAVKAAEAWRKRGRRWLRSLADGAAGRHLRSGEVAFLLEPDLKDGQGGLRDVHCLGWIEATGLLLLPGDRAPVQNAYDVLTTVRVALHRRAGRAGDVLALQEQDGVAADLGLASADELMARVSAAARTIAWTTDEAWHRVHSTLEGPSNRGLRRDHHLAPGIFVREDEVHLANEADAADDPALCLRMATVAARTGAAMHRPSLERLAATTPVFPDPWPVGASDELVALLLEGHRAIGPIEALDQLGLWVKVLPEWEPNRNRPQRNAYHRFTVDRHLLEAAANAADLAGRVSRPDLLMIGTLFHDIGKGYPGDHTDVGIDLVARLGPRLGFSPDDVSLLQQMVRHHLLLPDVATRRDLSDDGTIRLVADVAGSPTVLELLHALTIADSLATGPSAWNAWKAELVDELVDRAAHVVGGGDMREVVWRLFPDPAVLALMGEQQTAITVDSGRLTVVARDRPGLFSRVAGVLALHGLDVLAAQAHSDEQGMAASEFLCVEAEGVAWDRVVADLERALAGRLALEARLAERTRLYSRRKRSKSATPAARRVLIDNSVSSNATVIEVIAPDAIGVLYRITRALADLGLDIRHAKVQTLGHEVVDSFYVRDAEGAKVTDTAYLAELEREILYELNRT